MKKLLIMTGVAAFALGAFADIELPNGTGFDGATPYDSYWVVPSDLEAAATPYESGEALEDRPAYPNASGVNVNYLGIESASTNSPLTRYIGTLQDQESKAIGNGLYLDTLVQFTVSTETMGTSDTTAKLAIWAQTSDETPAETNFVVQAGYITASGVESHNYAMTVSTNNFDYTAWHRLTVKAINDIDESANTETVGFVVFVDGKALTRANSAAIGDEGYVPTLNTVAGKFADAVLPSRRGSVYNDYQTLQAVSFSGNGKIDEVSFTDVAPQFAASDIVFTLYVGDGITGFTLNGTSYSDFTDGFVTLKLNPGVTIVTVGDVTYADGYKNAALSDASDGTVADLVFTVTGDAPVATISAVRDMFFVGGKGYATLADAVKAVTSEANTITLNGNYTLTEDDFGEEGSSVFISTNVVIDLKGCALDSEETDSLFVLKEDASITFINTDATKDGELTCAVGVVWNDGKGSVIFGQKEDTNYVALNGAVLGIGGLSIVKGKFDVASNTEEEGGCAIAEEMVAEGSTLAAQSVGGYWVVDVGGDEPVEDEVIAVPEAVTGLVYDGTEKTGVAAGTGYTLTGNTGTNAGEYTATATLADGYVWADESNEAKSITWTIDKKTVTATITLAPASATYDAEKKTVDDYTDATVTFGGDTLANTDYTVTGLDTAVAEAGEFTITVAPAASGSNYTFDTVTAKLTVTAVQPPESEIEPVDPANGGTAEFKNADAAIAAADAINEDKAKYIAAPEGIANTYYDNVEAKADGTTVSVVFTTDGEAAAQTSANAEVDELDKVLSAAAVDATAATITGAVPGFFYSVVYGTSLTGESAFADEGARAQADKDGNVTIPVPTAGKGAGFYKVKVSPTK